MDSDERMPTNLRLLRILEEVAAAPEPPTPSEINRALGLPKASIHRLCQTLVAEGYLIRDTDPRRLRPARRLRGLATQLLAASDIHIARHQVLQGVVAETRETVNFVVPEEAGMRYLDRVEADWPLRVQLPVGSHVPFHCTASGKCFMASLAPVAARRFVACLLLDRRTARTQTDPDSLLAELAETRARGHAIDDQEFMEGMSAIAVPVRDEAGSFVAALAVHGPSVRLGQTQLLEAKDILVRAAAKIGAELY